MTDILIRNLDDPIVQKLKRRALRHGRSLHAEIHDILTRTAAQDIAEFSRLAAKIRRKLKGTKHSNSADLIREDRDR